MANPAPTINQINAFNATQGTTIDFNIIGGTELVRSNRIYIYDLSDNSLICTHLYVSTESIHELPKNTDGSIVYASGKSSANFVNGAQYYAQIQTYTDTAGTQGGSGLSVAKMFWCLVNPTLTITTIPSTISTTSYNVSATYTDTSASVVSNIIQQYQFNLYSATGSLLQSSGVVVGSGERQGTSATYRISYNLTGLSVGSSYYVVVDVTTTQGMNASAQSSTFTVSIDTPTLGEATVVNNACDGYISVTSNLSSEYGGSASGEIASFVTNSVNNVSSLKVALDPIQDLHGYDAPWVGGAGKNKYKVTATTTTTNNVTFTVNSDGTVKVKTNGTASATTVFYLSSITDAFASGSYIINGCSGGSGGTYMLRLYDSGGVTIVTDIGSGASFSNLARGRLAIVVISGTTVDTTFKPMIRLASETDATYAPYENICPIYGYGDGAGKNKLPYPYINTTKTADGITWTDNGDGTITANGTATSSAQFILTDSVPNSDYQGMVLNGCPSGGGANTYQVSAQVYGSPWTQFAPDRGSGVTISNSGYENIRFILQINSGVTVNNLVFKPMIRFASETDDTYSPYSNICPINTYVTGKNLVPQTPIERGQYYDGSWGATNTRITTTYIPISPNTNYFMQVGTNNVANLAFINYNYFDENKTWLGDRVINGDASFNGSTEHALNISNASAKFIRLTLRDKTSPSTDISSKTLANVELQFAQGNARTAFEPFGNTYTAQFSQTVYGGTLDIVSGKLTINKVSTTISSFSNRSVTATTGKYRFYTSAYSNALAPSSTSVVTTAICNEFNATSNINTYNNVTGFSLHHTEKRFYFYSDVLAELSLADANTWLLSNPIQVVYPLASPQTYQLTPQQIQTLIGKNNVWSNVGDVAMTYNIPITNLLVKRQDVADVSGTWLTLHSKPVTRASDMNFTFIDFTNQYGKTYKYALVPLLTQTQSGVEVEVEGGYTVSDEVQSIFDGVFIADQTNVERVKAGVGYGNIDMNQNVGTIVPIGSKYPIVITNSQNQYHNGSVRGKIVPNDFYSNGNLSRIDMVNKRDELEQFLTNKRAKIIKDWNGKIWLVMILSNVSCTFDDNYGMGMVEFSADWVEIGDPTTQQDLYNAGLINVGGV